MYGTLNHLHEILLCLKVLLVDDHDNLEVEKCSVRQQKNGYDCGLFLLRFAEALSNNDCIRISDGGTSFDRKKLEESLGGEEIGPTLRGQMLDYLLPHLSRQNGESPPANVDEGENAPVFNVTGDVPPVVFQAIKLSIPAMICPLLSLHSG